VVEAGRVFTTDVTDLHGCRRYSCNSDTGESVTAAATLTCGEIMTNAGEYWQAEVF
jgi:hypothetical protein